MASKLTNPIKDIKTELYRKEDFEDTGKWYRLFIITYKDGSGKVYIADEL